MMPFRQVRTILLLCALLPLTANATRMDCDHNETAELPVKVQVNIPAFLYFQVGNTNQTPELTYDLSSGMTSGAASGPIPPSGHSNLPPTSITGSDVSNGVNVTVRANCGQVKIAYSVSDSNGLGNGQGQFIAYDTLQTTSTDSGLPAPALSNSASTESLVTTTSYGSVTNRSTVWQYTYTNNTMPTAGTYQGTVTYQASCL